MNLYLDGMFYRCSGVGRVFENLLEMLISDEGIGEIRVAVPSGQKEAFLEQFPSGKVKPFFVDYGPMGLRDLFLKSVLLKSIAGKVSLFLFPGHNVPISVPGKYIVSVNDITVFTPYFSMPRWKKTGFRRHLARSMRGAGKVITISETVKKDLIREFGVPREKILVIYPWIKDSFFEDPKADPSVPMIAGDYILYLGLRIAHKNPEGLIRAFLLLTAEFPGLRLVIAGSRYRKPDSVDRWKEDSRLKDRLIEIPEPADDEIRRLFAGAKAFVFPSFAEGFGLPPLEAMASGIPVVCSDIPVFREVYGDAVHYVDPHRPESIAGGIGKVLNDPVYAALLAGRGRDRAGVYRKGRFTAEYMNLIK